MTQIVKVTGIDMIINHDVWPDWTLHYTTKTFASYFDHYYYPVR